MTDLLDLVQRAGQNAGGTMSALEILLRVTVLLVAAMLIAIGLRRSSAALRHLIWALSLVGVLLIPLCHLAFPCWRWAILPQQPESPPTTMVVVTEDAPLASPPRTAHAPPQPVAAPAVEPLGEAIVSPAPDRGPFVAAEVSPAIVKKTAPHADSPAPVAVRRTWSWPACLAAVWAGGAFLGLIWLAIGVIGAWYVARRARPADPQWGQVLRQVLAAGRLVRRVEVRQCPQVSIPMTWGLRRPVILVPAGSSAWSEAAKRSVLLHELGHIRRGDCLTHLLGRLACVVYWFHPLVWLAARQLRRASEQAADDIVLSSNIAPPDYAEHLVGIAAGMHGLHLFGYVALPMASPSDLEGRVLAILDSERNHRSLKRKTCYALMVLAALLLIPCAVLRLGYAQAAQDRATDAAAPQPDAKPAAAKILVPVSGTVYQADGKPAVAARVWAAAVFVHPPLRHFTETDAKGRFHLELEPLSAPSACWGVHARRGDQGGDANDDYGHVDVSPARAAAPVVIRMERRGSLRGRVVESETGKPIANVRIFLDGGEVVTSDVEGRYEVGGLHFRDHTMILVSAGRLRKRVLFDTSMQQSARLDVDLPLAGSVRGQVVDEDGKPVPGAWVSRPASGEALALNGFDECCDEQGRFVWDGMPFDQLVWGLDASAPGYSSDEHGQLVVRKGQAPLQLVFHLQRKEKPTPAAPPRTAAAAAAVASLPLRDLKGTVRSAEGTPLEGALVRWGATQYEETQREARSDARGHFQLPQVPDRAGYVTVIHEKYAPHFLAVQKGEAALNVKLHHGETVGGVVQSPSGRPLAGVQVAPVMPSPDRSLCNPFWLNERSTTTDSQGRFEIQELPNSLVLFDFMKLGSSELRNQSLKLGCRDNVVKMYASGAVRGVVVDPDGKPVRNFRIQIQIPRKRSPETPCGGFDAGYESLGVSFTSEDGAFVVSGLTVNTFARVVASASGHGQAAKDSCKVSPCNDLPPAAELRLQLTPPRALNVHVAGKADPGKPVADAAITLINEDPAVDRQFSWGYHNLHGRRSYTQADGSAILDEIPCDDALLTIEHAGFARQRLLWTPVRKEINVQLEPEAVITGTVMLEAGQPLAHCYVSLRSSEGDQYSVGIDPGDKGRFRFDQLPAGEYSLSVRDERRDLFTQKLTLQTGATKEVTVDVAKTELGGHSAAARASKQPSKKKEEKKTGVINATGAAYFAEGSMSIPPPPPPVLLSTAGKVLDASGNPVAGASVYLRQWPSSVWETDMKAEKKSPDILAQSQTDANGEFRFENVAAQSTAWHERLKQQPWDVIVTSPDSAIAWQHLAAPRQAASMTFRLQPEAKVTGRITDEAGRPLEGVEAAVALISPLTSGLFDFSPAPEFLDLRHGRVALRATTDAQGQLTLGGLPAERRLAIYLQRPGRHDGRVFVATTTKPQPKIQGIEETPEGGVESAQLPVHAGSFTAVLRAARSIRGIAVDAMTGKPLAGVQVSAWGKPYVQPYPIFPSPDSPAVTSDSEGRFIFPDMPKRTYYVMARPKGDSPYLGRFRIVPMPADQHDVQVRMELRRGEVLTGRVASKKDGKAIAGVAVLYDPEHGHDATKWPDGFGFTNIAETDRDGRFRLVVPAGKGAVQVSSATSQYATYPPPSTPPENTQEVQVVAGRPHAELVFSITPAEAGTRTPAWISMSGSAGPSSAPSLYPFAKVRSPIEGKVFDPDGRPVAGAVVGLRPWFESEVMISSGNSLRSENVDKNLLAKRFASTDSSGRFTLREIGVDEWGAVEAIHKQRHLMGSAELPDATRRGNAGEPLEIRLSPTGSVSGVAQKDGKPCRGVRVSIEEAGARVVFDRDDAAAEPDYVRGSGMEMLPPITSFRASTDTDAEGRFRFEAVPANKQCTVQIWARGLTPERTRYSVQVKPGENTQVPPFVFIPTNESVSGIVVDGQGKPVAGADISAWTGPNPLDIIPTGRAKPTGSDGRFTVTGLPKLPIILNVEISPRGGSGQPRNPQRAVWVRVQPGQKDVRVEVKPSPDAPKERTIHSRAQ